MTVRISNGLRNAIAGFQSYKDILANSVIDIYSGTQPATADTAASGTLLCTITKSSGAFTGEVKAVGSMTYSGSSSVVDFKVNGIDILGATVPYNTSVNQTATDIATQINTNPKNQLFIASTTGASGVVTITAVNGLGTLPNTWALTSTSGGLGSAVAMTGGVDAVNGLTYGAPASGVISKNAAETWSGVAGSAGFTSGTATAGWFRIRGSAAADAAADPIRLDGALATSGGDINLGSLTVAFGAPFTLSAFTITVPTS